MSKSILTINTPETCDDCPLCIYTAEEKRFIGYCNTSDDDYYCKALDRFMEYSVVSEDELVIAKKPVDCPLLELKVGTDEAIDIAIESMKAESCENTISRQAVIEAVHEEFDECLVLDESGEHIADEVERILACVPSAQPEQFRCPKCRYKDLPVCREDGGE